MKDDGKKVTMESTMAKVYASEAACRICDEGLQGVNRAEDDVKSET
jgi:alkylation response protein AidB-like acyl-CoA dehydrogenase